MKGFVIVTDEFDFKFQVRIQLKVERKGGVMSDQRWIGYKINEEFDRH